VPEHLRATYIRRLERALPLPEGERDAAIEEIEGHLEDAIGALRREGLPAALAEYRSLERLGTPERLAEELAAAHRTPRNVLIATGVGLRVAVGTALWSFIAVGAVLFTVGIAFVALYVLAQRLIPFPRVDLGSDASSTLIAGAVAISGYAVGRAVVPPVAIAARRRPAAARPIILLVGGGLAAWIGLTWLRQPWSIEGAIVVALLPAWFTLGVLAPRLVPLWLPSRRVIGGIALMAIVLSVVGLFVAGPGTPAGEAVEREVDPATEFGVIAPFDHSFGPPLEMIPTAPQTVPIDSGSGRITWYQQWALSRPDALAGWQDVHVEVWASPALMRMDGSLIDHATGPLASAPLSVLARRASASLSFEALPNYGFYHLAVVGTDPDGERQLAAWPGFRQWTWVGTPLEFFVAILG
jgi:hypothetical protein